MASLLAEAARIAGSDGPVEDRVVAIRLLGLADTEDSAWIVSQPLGRTPTDGRSTGGIAGSRRPFSIGEVAREIIMQWKSMSPSVRSEAVEVLFSRREGFEAVIGALESRAILPSDLDPARLKQLQAYPEPSLQGAGPEDSCGGNVGLARPKPGHCFVPRRRSRLPGIAGKVAMSSPRYAPPAIRPRVAGSTSGPTWRRSRADLRRTFSPTSLTRTERSRRIS